MADRLTRWEGHNPDGSPRAVLVAHDGPFAEILQPALAKLADFEDLAEGECKYCAGMPIITLCDGGNVAIVKVRGHDLYMDTDTGWTAWNTGVRGGRRINFCPMCGRYLE